MSRGFQLDVAIAEKLSTIWPMIFVMSEIVYAGSPQPGMEKRAITHLGMALNDPLCQWKVSREQLVTLEAAVQFAEARENIVSEGKPTAKLHHVTQSNCCHNSDLQQDEEIMLLR